MDKNTEINIRTTKVICCEFGVSDEMLFPETKLREDLCGDSLDVVVLVIELEKEFDIDITDEENESLVTVGDVHCLIEKKVHG